MRVAAIAAGAVLVFGLAACGGGSGSTTAAATGTTAGGAVAAGREVFLSTGCGACHGLQEAGTNGTVGPNLDEDLVGDAQVAGAQLDEYVRASIVDPDAVVMPRYAVGTMPTDYGSKLSGTELDDLVAFLVDAAG